MDEPRLEDDEEEDMERFPLMKARNLDVDHMLLPEKAIFWRMISDERRNIKCIAYAAFIIIVVLFIMSLTLFSYGVHSRGSYCDKPIWIPISGLGLVFAGQIILTSIHICLPLQRWTMRLILSTAVLIGIAELCFLLLATVYIFQINHCNKSLQVTSGAVIALSWLFVIIGLAVKHLRNSDERTTTTPQYWSDNNNNNKADEQV